MSFIEKLSNFKENCCAGPIIPLTLAGCIFGAIYLPLKYMPAAVITTSDKVKFAAMILAGTYVVLTSCVLIKSLFYGKYHDYISQLGRLHQFTIIIYDVFIGVVLHHLGYSENEA